MDPKAKAYFEKSAIKYSKGDVIALLNSRLSCAGPLLTTTLNGIDNLGGMCYGFAQQVGDRSIKVMTEKMGFPEDVAKLLYEVIRCGIVHQGMPKMGLEFFVAYNRFAGDEIFYKKSDGYIFMNVTEFAYRYLDIIDKITRDPEIHIVDYPRYNEEKGKAFKKAFDNAKDYITRDIEDYEKARLSGWEAEEKARYERGESASAYTPDMVFRIELAPSEE
jgi:hypothetical protein